MIIYLHMHKCAGTSVVRAAQAGGLRLPALHQNGNLLDPDGKPLKYRNVSRADLAMLLLQHRADGVEFIAMEWDFPPFDWFDEGPPVRFFTSLREPAARAISNFRMDKVAGWIAPDMRFGDYINGDALYRSDNYYTKILCRRWPRDTVTAADHDHALAVLSAFEAVILVEQGNMAQVLAQFGMAPEPFRFNRFDAERARDRLGDDRALAVSQSEIGDFIARNTCDFALYRHFTRAVRMAQAADRKDTAHG
jgi:hypothetical protein